MPKLRKELNNIYSEIINHESANKIKGSKNKNIASTTMQDSVLVDSRWINNLSELQGALDIYSGLPSPPQSKNEVLSNLCSITSSQFTDAYIMTHLIG